MHVRDSRVLRCRFFRPIWNTVIARSVSIHGQEPRGRYCRTHSGPTSKKKGGPFWAALFCTLLGWKVRRLTSLEPEALSRQHFRSRTHRNTDVGGVTVEMICPSTPGHRLGSLAGAWKFTWLNTL